MESIIKSIQKISISLSNKWTTNNNNNKLHHKPLSRQSQSRQKFNDQHHNHKPLLSPFHTTHRSNLHKRYRVQTSTTTNFNTPYLHCTITNFYHSYQHLTHLKPYPTSYVVQSYHHKTPSTSVQTSILATTNPLSPSLKPLYTITNTTSILHIMQRK